MPIQSDLSLDPAKFLAANATDAMRGLAQALKDGSAPWPATTPHPAASEVEIPSREEGRTVPVRVLRPGNGKPSKGIFLHIHGGGWTAFTHRDFDEKLLACANGVQMTVLSVGYRLAPAHRYPAAVHDCIDVAEYLASDAGQLKFGGEVLKAIGGESAGGHLAAVTGLHLAKARPQAAAKLAGLVLVYGCFDLSLSTPSMVTNVPGSTALVDRDNMKACVEGFLPPSLATPEQRRASELSPLYEDLSGVAANMPGGKLPPALFICGTADPLLDDTVLMSSKWMATGSDAMVKIYPGAPHGFDIFPGVVKEAGEALETVHQFLLERV
ncbi:hypothetical protein MAPG_04680 [Magnaporthiopsis poae ATCC 64411]|uniref:Alpha/beta hydrolase fold-3 domain-containing protein n=1 Tax=Magnaporthiopsis poae (strain ATCC 64411 / 73-15) TaxID=644358 RepID=A0A0C4DXD5_MAGP6|nr:hypothetical protein MAPG_04680 [Magnaporthiopsis poae ATCC 64411]